MINVNEITAIAERILAEESNGDLFLVEVKVSGAAEIEVVIDSDQSLGIDRCMAISREIETVIYAQEGEEADFSLTVMSAGIGQPIRFLRQYEKLLRREHPAVDVLYKDGQKLTGVELVEAGEEAIEVEYEVKELIEGKKRKQTVRKRERVPFEAVKSISEHLKIK